MQNYRMGKALTTTDALVLSLLNWPEGPHDLPKVFDAFARVVDGISTDVGVLGCVDGGDLVMAHVSDPETMFRATPVLADGWAPPTMMPATWHGRLTRSRLAAYFRSEWLGTPCEPSWGAHMLFASPPREVGDSLVIQMENLAKRPLVDPLRELAAEDTPEWLALSVQPDGEWAGLLTDWEGTDAFLAETQPGAAWSAARTRRVICPAPKHWWQLRGWRDAADSRRYCGQWEEPIPITVFLGWPAYAVAAAVSTAPCDSCGKATIKGRRFCGGPECNRARAIARQRASRSRPVRLPRVGEI